MKYEFKGTPGPWIYDPIEKEVIEQEPYPALIICQVAGGIDEQPQNGTLMAAAPELLEALLWFMDYPEEDINRWINGQQPIVCTFSPLHFKKAREAIHKALNIQ